MTEPTENPKTRADSVIGITTECVIMDYYATDGMILAMPTDPYIMERVREQCKAYSLYRMNQKP